MKTSASVYKWKIEKKIWCTDEKKKEKKTSLIPNSYMKANFKQYSVSDQL